jgi:hypothetical protein
VKNRGVQNREHLNSLQEFNSYYPSLSNRFAKATIIFWVSTGLILGKFGLWRFFEIISKKIQVLLKSEKNDGYFTIHEDMYIYDTRVIH